MTKKEYQAKRKALIKEQEKSCDPMRKEEIEWEIYELDKEYQEKDEYYFVIGF